MTDQPRGAIDWARQQAAERAAGQHHRPKGDRMANIEAILIGLLSVAHTPEQAKHAARTVLRDHAHQLAEQIRQDARARHDRDYSDNRIFRLTGAQAAADLIDPEVQP